MSTTRIGRYEIEKELGRGAMAVVYKAVDPLIGRVVAIKTIRLESTAGMEQTELKKRLYREAQSAGNLSHPNIVTIYDIGEESDTSYIAMEFIEGESLQDWMAKNPLPAVEQTIAIIEQIASGLNYAAARGIIHRDIKPGNILLTPDMGAKIADFGIAKFSSSNFTQTGVIMGTPAYMSPEQAMGRALDGRSDIFSLGVIFYEMLTGERPFSGSNPTTIIYKILHEEPVPPRKLNVTLHPGLDWIVRRMLEKDPSQRYQSCAEFIQDLKNYPSLGSQAATNAQPAAAPPTVTLPTTAQPTVTQPEPAKAGGGHKYLIFALVALLIAVSGLLGFFYYRQIQRGSTSGTSVVVPTPAPPPVQGSSQGQTPQTASEKAGPAPGKEVAIPEQQATPTEKQAAASLTLPPAAEKKVTPAEKQAPESQAPAPEKPASAQVRFEFSGDAYPATVYDGSRRLGNITSGPLSVQVSAGEHRFRVVSEEIYLDRQLDRVRLKPEEARPIALPGLSSAYVEVPNDAYEGCEILLNGKLLPTPYPAQIPKLVAGDNRVVFRWKSGKYAGKELTYILSSQENHLYRVRGEPESGGVVVQKVK